MKTLNVLAIAVAIVASAPAVAQEKPAAAAVVVHRGQMVMSADGRRVGHVDSIVGTDAAPTAVKVIKDLKMIVIPASTLSAGDAPSRVVTSLKYSEIR